MRKCESCDGRGFYLNGLPPDTKDCEWCDGHGYLTTTDTCVCGALLADDADDCPACAADRARSLADYQRHGGYHPNLAPPGAWKSREYLIRDDGATDAG